MVVSEHLLKLCFKFGDLSHVFVLNPKVTHLGLDVPDLRPQLVLFLNAGDQCIKVLLESLDLHVDILSELIFGSVFENTLFDLLVDLFDLSGDVNGVALQVLDFFDDLLDAGVLALDLTDDLVNTLKVLVPVHIFGSCVPLLLHKLHNLFLVLDLGNSSLELLLQLLDFFIFVIVLNLLVLYVLLDLQDFISGSLLVTFPLLL